jgi:UDP-N-acetylmuramoylalanine--D-glutamate ligase
MTAIPLNSDSQAYPQTLVVGLGKTGLSCARYLARRGVPVAVCDSRVSPPGLDDLTRELPAVPVFTGGFDDQVFAAAERIVVSPGVPVAEPHVRDAHARGVEVLGDIELFARQAAAPIVAITGSNGKSTVTVLVGAMARAAGMHVAIGGNLGEPALDLLSPGVELYVLELSSFQLETAWSLHPEAAVVLNVSPDHMDRYESVDAYAQVKASIFAHAQTAVVNLDDPLVRAMAGGRERMVFSLEVPRAGEFGIRELDGRRWLSRGEQRLMATDELLIAGRHNHANALAALALGTAIGLPVGSMLKVLRTFRGLPHRTSFVAEIDGVRWYNDSKGTNPGACVAALEGLDAGDDTRSVLIAGGDCKGASFDDIVVAAKHFARAVVLIGRDAEEIARVLVDHVPVERATDLADAVARAALMAVPGDRVLLSPACASFDMFRDYVHRGECFESLVREIAS